MAKRRPSGDGMVRKRDDGRWEGRIVVGHKANGDSIFHYVYADTQKELTVKLRRHIEAYRGVDLTEQSGMTLGEWLDQWLAGMEGTIRPTTTFTRYRGTVEKHLKPYLGSKKLSQLTARDIQRLYETLAKEGRQDGQGGLASGTIRGIHTVFHGALKAAQQASLIARNPTEELEPPRFRYKGKQILTDEQLDVFIKIITEDEIWHNFFYTGLTTGLRRGEICGLKWEDFDEVNGTLKVRRTVHVEKGGRRTTWDTKTNAGMRTITLSSGTAELLRNRKQSALSDWIFPDPLKPEEPTNPSFAYSRLKTLLRKAGLPSIPFHALRHTFSTLVLENGMDIKTLSTILGHVSVATTLDIYTHITGDMQRTAAANIDRGIGKVGPTQEIASPQPEQPKIVDFKPYKGRMRKPGTGCISLISEHCWEGRYSPVWPDGKKHSRNVYAKTREECEMLLSGLIIEMKAEIQAIKESGNMSAIPDSTSKKKKQIAVYMKEHPEVTNKSQIAREVQVDRNTVV